MKRYLYKDLYDHEEKHWWHLAKRRLVVDLAQKYLIGRSTKILDIGCGTGENMRALAKFGQTWGIDVSSEAIRFCKKRGIRNVKVGSIEGTNMQKESFDLVTVLDVLEHTDDKKSLVEIFRILRKNGLLIITVPAFQWLWGEWDRVLHHKRRYTRANLEKLVRLYGFEIVKSSYMFSFLILPVWLVRIVKSKLYSKAYPSDFTMQLPFVNFSFKLLSEVESFFVKKVTIPFGTTIVCVAKKG